MNRALQNFELSSTEKELKHLYLMNPSRNLEAPCEQAEVMDILALSYVNLEASFFNHLSDKISEQTFISKDMDTALVRHARYTPAFFHKHDFFELLCVLSGECMNTILDKSITMKAGDICMIAPGVIHSISAFSDDDNLLNILIRKSTFEESFLGLLEGDDILSNFFKRTFYQTTEIPYLLFHTGNDAKIFQYIENIYNEYTQNKRYKKKMLNTLLSAFFINLLRSHEQHLEIPSIHLNASSENLMYILRYMQSNYKTLTLKELAKFFNYSERQLQRIILQATGFTFIENVQKQKMNKATDLLLHSDLPISAISEQVGFQSINNFRKIFYKYYQMTPSEYRIDTKSIGISTK